MTSDPSPDRRSAVLVAGLVSFTLLGAGQAVMGPALPVFQHSFAISTATSGWLISALGIGSFLGLVGMYLYGSHISARMALTGMAAGAAGVALAPDLALALMGAVIFGAGYGAIAAIFNVRVLSAFGRKGPSMVSLLNAAYSVGAIVAPLVFVALGSRPSMVFWIIAAAAAATILIVGGPGVAQHAAPVGRTGFRLHLPILGFGLIGAGIEVCLGGLGPSALIRAGVKPDHAAELLSVFFIAFLASRLVLALIADRVPPFAIYTGAVFFTGLCGLCSALFDPAIAFPVTGLSAGLLFPGYFVTAAAKMGNDSRVAPVILATAQIGAVATPLFVAQLIPGMGERGFFWMLTALSAAATLMALGFYRQMTR